MSALTPEQQDRLLAIMMDHARAGETAALQEAYERGYPLDIKDGDGNTALMLASYNGQVETLQMLITRGANVNLRNNRDQSPIAGAIFKGEEEVVKFCARLVLIWTPGHPRLGKPPNYSERRNCWNKKNRWLPGNIREATDLLSERYLTAGVLSGFGSVLDAAPAVTSSIARRTPSP